LIACAINLNKTKKKPPPKIDFISTAYFISFKK
jgi:hypothetical protein